MNLNEEDRTKLKKSGNGSIFANKVHWSKYYLKKAGCVISPDKGEVEITKAGLKILQKKIQKLDRQFLEKNLVDM